MAKIQGKETVIVTEEHSARKLSGNVRVIKPGDTVDVEGLKVTGVPSYNTGKDFHPRKNRWLGFIVEMDGVKIYHAGDTDFIPEMKEFSVDIALIPVSGTYVMDAEQAVQAAWRSNLDWRSPCTTAPLSAMKRMPFISRKSWKARCRSAF